MSDGRKRVAKVPARTGAKIRLVLRRGAGDTVHIRAYKFNQIYARTARFGECGKNGCPHSYGARKFSGESYAATTAINITSASAKSSPSRVKIQSR